MASTILGTGHWPTQRVDGEWKAEDENQIMRFVFILSNVERKPNKTEKISKTNEWYMRYLGEVVVSLRIFQIIYQQCVVCVCVCGLWIHDYGTSMRT